MSLTRISTLILLFATASIGYGQNFDTPPPDDSDFNSSLFVIPPPDDVPEIYVPPNFINPQSTDDLFAPSVPNGTANTWQQLGPAPTTNGQVEGLVDDM